MSNDRPSIPLVLRTEADVEDKLIHNLLRDPFQLDIPEESIRNKEFLRPTALDKKGGRTSGYVPDYAITIGSLPIMIVEAKSPDTDPEVGYREAGLYAYHLNKQFKHGVNPCQRILATNGKRILAGRWDQDKPDVDLRLKDLVSGGAAFSQLRDVCSYSSLEQIYRNIAPKLRTHAIYAPASLSGGAALLNAKKPPNTFAAPLSPILKRYFSSKQQNDDSEIYDKAYISSEEISTYDETLRTLLRERVVDLRGSTSKTLHPSSDTEPHLTKAIRNSAGQNAGDIQLVTGGVGAGKSLFIRRYKEMLQTPELAERTRWAFIDFNLAPSLQNAEAWMCERFVESFSDENDWDALDSENWPSVFAVDLSRRKGIYDDIAKSSKEQATSRRAEDLGEWLKDPRKVAKGVTRYFQGDQGDKKNIVVVVMDNVDRLGKDEQLEVFRLSLWFMDQTRTFVVLNLRDDTYERFKNEPPLDTYRSGVSFHIQPPKFIDVVRKRLELSAEFLADRVQDRLEYHAGVVRFSYPKGLVGEFLKELYVEIFERHKNLSQVIQGLAGRDVRKALAIFESILRSGHLSDQNITSQLRGDKGFEITEDVILRTLMRGEYQFHSEHSGFVANIFYMDSAWERPSPFLVPDLMFTLWKRRKLVGELGVEGYFSVERLARDFELRGYVVKDVVSACEYCLRQGLVEADHFGRKLQEVSDCIKITLSGFVHLRFLIDQVEYLYGVLPTTPFFDQRVAGEIAKSLDREQQGKVVTTEQQVQCVEMLYRQLKKHYAEWVTYFPLFGGQDRGSSYVLDRIEGTLADQKGRRNKTERSRLDEI